MKKLLSTALAACLLIQTPAVFAESTPTDSVTEEKTEAPISETPTQTEEAKETENPEPTKEEATEAPTQDTTPVPEQTPDPTATAETKVPDNAEAWMQSEDGILYYGDLVDVIAQAAEGTTIYLHTDEPMLVKDAPLLKMSKLKIVLDKEYFSKGEWRIAYSEESPENVEKPEELDTADFGKAKEDDVLTMYIWAAEVVEEPDPTATPDPAEAKISVTPQGYITGTWNTEAPSFTLSGIPEGANWTYAAVIYDERIETVEGDTYTVSEEGVYSLRFAIVDENGDFLSTSSAYTILFDQTPPDVSAMVDESQSYTLTVSASDAVSRVKAISIDGGVTWNTLEDGGTFTYTATAEETLAPGMVQVRDKAGNVWTNTEAYTLKKISNGGNGGGGGGGDGSGSGGKAQPHAKSEGKEGEYDALEMTLPEEPMHTLTIDSTELALTLDLVSAENFEIPADYQAAFTAELARWTKPETDAAEEPTDEYDVPLTEEKDKPDTLILTAVEEENMGDRFEYRWKFNGEVYRLLANSGIKYLALNVGGDIAVFPTEGFTGGTKYTDLKMAGVSTKKFDYTVSMTTNLDPDHIPVLNDYDYSEDCDLAVQVEVEGEKYTMSAEQKGEMYYYNVYLGARDMMDVPYGEYTRPVHD